MATDPAVRQLYPLSTADAESIPLDVAAPLSLYSRTIAAEVATQIDIPDDMSLVMIHATVAVVIDFNNAAAYPLAAEDTKLAALYVPADTIMTIWLPTTGPAKVVPVFPEFPGALFIQGIQKWAALGLKRQLGIR